MIRALGLGVVQSQLAGGGWAGDRRHVHGFLPVDLTAFKPDSVEIRWRVWAQAPQSNLSEGSRSWRAAVQGPSEPNKLPWRRWVAWIAILRMNPRTSLPEIPPPAAPVAIERIWGVPFYVGLPGPELREALRRRLVVVPSGPGLGHDFAVDPDYAAALRGADFALVDSGFFTLLWFVRTGRWLPRISGLRVLSDLIRNEPEWLSSESYWVMPSVEDRDAHVRWLLSQQVLLDHERDCYVAPQYPAGPIHDPDLVVRLRVRRPRLVVICLGGGVQERLGFSLRAELENVPAILCTGAAIAFLSGRQARIPVWADRLFLGWFLRVLSHPAAYTQRYVRALKLIPRVWGGPANGRN